MSIKIKKIEGSCCPIYYQAHLGVSFQVVIKHVDTNSQISCVVWIDPVPALRSELTPLAHNGVEVAEGKEDRLELTLTGAHFKGILGLEKMQNE